MLPLGNPDQQEGRVGWKEPTLPSSGHCLQIDFRGKEIYNEYGEHMVGCQKDNNDLLHETPTSRVYAWIELVEGPFSITAANEVCRRLTAEHHQYLVRTHGSTAARLHILSL